MAFFKEFKEFALKGNVMDMAVGVIIGGAFSTLVTSLTDNLISPILGILGKVNFDAMMWDVFGDGKLVFKYGAFITAFADTDSNDVVLPETIAEVCTIASGRTEEGWLSAYDYTAESGWTYFVNDEYAQVGIADYTPADGDVVVFSFTVYGYGADLGVDNSSWGGAAALKEQVKTAELVKLFADNKDLLNGSDEQAYAFTAAGEALAQYESTQEDVDNAVDRLENILGTETLVTEESPSADAAAESEDAIDAADDGASGEKGSPSTGVEGVAVAVAVVILAGAGIAMSKKQ